MSIKHDDATLTEQFPQRNKCMTNVRLFRIPFDRIYETNDWNKNCLFIKQTMCRYVCHGISNGNSFTGALSFPATVLFIVQELFTFFYAWKCSVPSPSTSALPFVSHMVSWQCAVSIWFWCMNSNLIWTISPSHSLAVFALSICRSTSVSFAIVYVMRLIWLFSVSKFKWQSFSTSPTNAYMSYVWCTPTRQQYYTNLFVPIETLTKKEAELKLIERQIKWTSVYCVLLLLLLLASSFAKSIVLLQLIFHFVIGYT